MYTLLAAAAGITRPSCFRAMSLTQRHTPYTAVTYAVSGSEHSSISLHRLLVGSLFRCLGRRRRCCCCRCRCCCRRSSRKLRLFRTKIRDGEENALHFETSQEAGAIHTPDQHQMGAAYRTPGPLVLPTITGGTEGTNTHPCPNRLESFGRNAGTGERGQQWGRGRGGGRRRRWGSVGGV